MMSVTGLIASILALAAFQDAPPPPTASDEVVVTGVRDRDKQVRDFVSALTPAPQGSLPRFMDQVCPRTVGLVSLQNDAISTRLRQVAGAAGLRVAGSDCTPNIFVIVTADKKAFIEALAKRQPDAFAMLSAREIRRLARSPGPAAAWQLEGPVDRSGNPLPYDADLQLYFSRSTENASRIRAVTTRGFDAAVLVVESGALKGLTATQLADYASLRLLAKADPARVPASQAPSTILTVLDAPIGAALPVTLTAWDLGLLRGIYTSSAGLNAGAQRSQIVGKVNAAVARSEQE